MAKDFTYMTSYESIAANQTTQTLGVTGKVGDVLERIVCSVVTTGATGTVAIKDGTNTALTIVPANTPVGVYTVILGARSVQGAWQVTTGAAATAVAVGRFT